MRRIFSAFSRESPKPSLANKQNNSQNLVQVGKAAQTLSKNILDSVQAILASQINQDDDVVFTHMINLLAESEEMSVLLTDSSKDGFIDICNEAGIANSLMNALRLLRMIEIKHANRINTGNSNCGSGSRGGSNFSTGNGTPITYTASMNLCSLLSTLCADSQTLDTLKQSLIKLLCFPMGVLPESGYHLQHHSASVITILCNKGLSNSMVWFLHDIQAISMMIRQLHDLMNISDNNGEGRNNNENLLYGKKAECREMWIVSISCLADLLSNATSVSGGTVLITDLEKCGGVEVLIDAVWYSDSMRAMSLLATISRIFSEGRKDQNEPLSHTGIGRIFSGILQRISNSKDVNVQISYQHEDLLQMCRHLVTKSESIFEKEYLIQNIAYTLMTLYSTNIQNCTSLEEEYQFISSLIILIPALNDFETIAAIKMGITYTCQSIEGVVSSPITTLCVVALVLIDDIKFINNGEASVRKADEKFKIVCHICHAIVNANGNFGMIILRCGFHTHLLIGLFEELSRLSKERRQYTKINVVPYVKLLETTKKIIVQDKEVIVELQKMTFPHILKELILSEWIEADLLNAILSLNECIAIVDGTFVEQQFQSMIDYIQILKDDLNRLAYLLGSLLRSLKSFDNALQLWDNIGGMQFLLMIIPSVIEESIAASASECIILLIRCILQASQVYKNKKYPYIDSCNRALNLSQMKRSFFDLANHLKSSIFLNSSIVDNVINELFNHIVKPDYYYGASCSIIVAIIIPHLEEKKAMLIIQRIIKYIKDGNGVCGRLVDAGFVEEVLYQFHRYLKGKIYTGSVGSVLTDLALTCCQEKWTIENFLSIVKYFIRPLVIVGVHVNSLPFLQHYQSPSNGDESIDWSIISQLCNIEKKNSVNLGVPHLVFYNKTDKETFKSSSGSSVTFDWEFNNIESNSDRINFTLNMWILVNPKSAFTEDTIIPLVSISSYTTSQPLLDISYHMSSSSTYINLPSASGDGEICDFKSSFTHTTCHVWQMMTFVFRTIKQDSETHLQVSFYMNGVSGKHRGRKSISFPMTFDMQKIHCEIGNADRWSFYSFSCINTWSMGPLVLFDSALSFKQVAHLFMKEPSYIGHYQGESPLCDGLVTLTSEMLMRCNNITTNVVAHIDQIGYKGLEEIVEPWNTPKLPIFELESLPSPSAIFTSINSEYSTDAQGEKNVHLLNSATNKKNCEQPHNITARLHQGSINHGSSIGKCVAAIGICNLFLPLLHSANTEVGILNSLRLLHVVMRGNSVNLKGMQRTGYRMVAWILYSKPGSIITEAVINALFEFSFHRSINSQGMLLVDSLALNHFILNHQLWELRNMKHAQHIAVLISKLVNDDQYSCINCIRLSNMGIVSWMMMMLTTGIETFCPTGDWTPYNCSFRDALEGRESKETVVYTIVDSLSRIIMTNGVRQKDLDLIGNTLVYTLIQPTQSSNGETELNAFGVLRVALLRCLIMYHDRCSFASTSNTHAIFRNTLKPNWFLMLIENPHSDFVTVGFSLRLLGMLVEQDSSYRRNFIDIGGFHAICKYLTSVKKDVAIILPVIAIFLRIPMQYVPLSLDIESSKRIVKILELDEALGPFISEIEMLGMSLPLISALISSTVAHPIQNDITQHEIVVLLVSGLLQKSIEMHDSTRKLMQCRTALHSLALSMIHASQALQFEKGMLYEGVLDLKSRAIEEYIDDQQKHKNNMRRSGSFGDVDDNVESPDISYFALKNVMLTLLIMSLENGDYPQILIDLMLSFPKVTPPSYIISYQKLVLVIFNDAIIRLQMIKNIDTASHIVNSIVLLIPLARSRLLDDQVSFGLLNILVKCLEDLWNRKLPGLSKISREMGTTMKAFAVICMHRSIFTFDVSHNKSVFEFVRKNLRIFCQPFVEERFEMVQSTIPSNVTGVDCLDMFHLQLGSDKERYLKKSVSTYVQLALAERNRIASTFIVSTFLMAFEMMKNKESCIGVEALRVLSYLQILVNKYIFKFLSGEFLKTTNTGLLLERAVDGFNCLRPLGAESDAYEQHLRESTDDFPGEINLFSNFLSWYDSNQAAMDSILKTSYITFNESLGELLSITDAFKWHQVRRSNTDSISTENSRIEMYMKRKRIMTQIKRVLSLNIQQWLVNGVNKLSSACRQWRHLWSLSLTGSLYGTDHLYTGMDSIDSDAIISPSKYKWTLNMSEGPERIRLKIDVMTIRNDDNKGTLSYSDLTKPQKVASDANGDDPDDVVNLMNRIAKSGAMRNFIEDHSSVGYDDETLDVVENKSNQVVDDSIFTTGTVVGEQDPEDDSETVSGGHFQSIYDTTKADDFISNIEDQTFKNSLWINTVIQGIVGAKDWKGGLFYNVEIIFGLDYIPAILILGHEQLHIIANVKFEVINTNQKIRHLDKVLKYHSSRKNFAGSGQPPGERQQQGERNTDIWKLNLWHQLLSDDHGYQSMNFAEIYSVYRLRHELKSTALEISSIRQHRTILFAANEVSECDTILSKLMERNLPNLELNRVGIPNLSNLAKAVRSRATLFANLSRQNLANLTKQWQKGEITNFDYLMYLNSAAGRSFRDLTQYPVFPWIIADYHSDALDLNDPKTFRDLSSPMGVMSKKRADQFEERYRSLDAARDDENATKPFHYGTHYSSMGYVLHFLMRLQPYTDMSIALQGGQLDKPDRMFRSLSESWKSASSDNVQDVRELIPEFFFLPEFLENNNNMIFGETQTGEIVNHVELPPWADNDPVKFIRLHRAALECRYVSENLHHWIDLIFGFKQRGYAAVESRNVFIHVTYDGEVDIDAITDPILREATISQINNFGQTPSMLFRKPHPKRIVPDFDIQSTVIHHRGSLTPAAEYSNALLWHDRCAPPFCTNASPKPGSLLHLVFYSVVDPKSSPSVDSNHHVMGDLCILDKERIGCIPPGSLFLPPLYNTFVKISEPIDGFSFYSYKSGEYHENITCLSTHERLHSSSITCLHVSLDGSLIVTGSTDLSVRLWDISSYDDKRKVELVMDMSGHNSPIISVSICSCQSLIVSGSTDGTANMWDYNSRILRCRIGLHDGPVISTGINRLNGNVFSLTVSSLWVSSVNGKLISQIQFHNNPEGSCLHVIPCPDWQRGVVAVTGHRDGSLNLWTFTNSDQGNNCALYLKNDQELRVARTLVGTHTQCICSMRLLINSDVVGLAMRQANKAFYASNSYELLVGDVGGNLSRWRTNIQASNETNNKQQRI